MRYGLEVPNGGECGAPAVLAELAALTEEAGWDGIFLEDYICYYGGPAVPTYDPWVTLAAMALRTTHIRLGTRVFVAGEITGIGGASVAVPQGALAGLAAARRLGKWGELETRQREARYRKELRHQLRFAHALRHLFAVRPGWRMWLTPDTTVCRCEEVRYHDIDAAVLRYRARDAKAVKSITRAGMGFCQGRICGHAVAAATAALSGRAVAEVGAFLSRPIAQPVLLADMVAGRDA